MNDLSNYHSQEQIIAELKKELRSSKAEVKKLTARLDKQIESSTNKIGKLMERQYESTLLLKSNDYKYKLSMIELKDAHRKEIKRLHANSNKADIRISQLMATRAVKDTVIANSRENLAKAKKVSAGMLATKVRIANRLGAGDNVVDIIKDLGVSSATVAVINKLIKGNE